MNVLEEVKLHLKIISTERQTYRFSIPRNNKKRSWFLGLFKPPVNSVKSQRCRCYREMPTKWRR